MTGLAVLAFLGAGTLPTEGPDATLVGGALTYLRNVQDSEGCFGPRTSGRFVYHHAAATMALAEALWLTRDECYLESAAKARDFLLKARNPYLGWRYGVRNGDNDTSVTAWCALALRTCRFAGLDVPEESFDGARAWFDKMTATPDPRDGRRRRVGYQQRGGPDARAWVGELRDWFGKARTGLVTGPDKHASWDSRRFSQERWSSLTAQVAVVVTLVGGAESADIVGAWSDTLSWDPPQLDEGGFLDLHYLLFGSLFHAQRPIPSRSGRNWRHAALADLCATQTKNRDCAGGSWDPDADPFGFVGGRVYATAMAVLALQAPNRFPKTWNPVRRAPPPAPERR